MHCICSGEIHLSELLEYYKPIIMCRYSCSTVLNPIPDSVKYAYYIFNSFNSSVVEMKVVHVKDKVILQIRMYLFNLIREICLFAFLP